MPRDGELTLLQRYRELRWLLLFNRALASRRGAEPDLLWAVGVQESNLSLQYLECLAGHMQPKSKMFDLWPPRVLWEGRRDESFSLFPTFCCYQVGLSISCGTKEGVWAEFRAVSFNFWSRGVLNPGTPSTWEAAALPSALLLIPLQLAAENLRATLGHKIHCPLLFGI